MVHQYVHSAKAYIGGSGRRSVWAPSIQARCILRPQYWHDSDSLPSITLKRIGQPRVGFCDITGQTNERTMLASWIPASVVCGNKVPTITFEAHNGTARVVASCFLAIANSFVFDWMLRRVVTTTINYFILESLPFPKLDFSSSTAKELCARVGSISACEHFREGLTAPLATWQHAKHRARIEAIVAALYGLKLSELEHIIDDFPLLDRSQPPIDGETRSTVTRDLVLFESCIELGGRSSYVTRLKERIAKALARGAVPFVPSHFSKGGTDVRTSQACILS